MAGLTLTLTLTLTLIGSGAGLRQVHAGAIRMEAWRVWGRKSTCNKRRVWGHKSTCNKRRVWGHKRQQQQEARVGPQEATAYAVSRQSMPSAILPT